MTSDDQLEFELYLTFDDLSAFQKYIPWWGLTKIWFSKPFFDQEWAPWAKIAEMCEKVIITVKVTDSRSTASTTWWTPGTSPSTRCFTLLHYCLQLFNVLFLAAFPSSSLREQTMSMSFFFSWNTTSGTHQASAQVLHKQYPPMCY